MPGLQAKWSGYGTWAVASLVLALALVPLLLAQGSATVTAVDPTMGKVNDTVTVTGENLGKENVSAVFLSDDNDDFKATLVEQAADKIVMKVPETKVGRYNISIQVKDRILILPLKFDVME
jgi:IPT/TIG domain